MWCHNFLAKFGIQTARYRKAQFDKMRRMNALASMSDSIERGLNAAGYAKVPMRPKQIIEQSMDEFASWRTGQRTYRLSTSGYYDVCGTTLYLEDREYTQAEILKMIDDKKASQRGEA